MIITKVYKIDEQIKSIFNMEVITKLFTEEV